MKRKVTMVGMTKTSPPRKLGALSSAKNIVWAGGLGRTDNYLEEFVVWLTVAA